MADRVIGETVKKSIDSLWTDILNARELFHERQPSQRNVEEHE